MALPLALMTWGGGAWAAGFETEVAPRPAQVAAAPARRASAGEIRRRKTDDGSPVAGSVGGARATPALFRGAEGRALGAAANAAPLTFEDGESRLRSASSGWEWGAGSAGLAAWLLGLRRRWQRPKV